MNPKDLYKTPHDAAEQPQSPGGGFTLAELDTFSMALILAIHRNNNAITQTFSYEAIKALTECNIKLRELNTKVRNMIDNMMEAEQ